MSECLICYDEDVMVLKCDFCVFYQCTDCAWKTKPRCPHCRRTFNGFFGKVTDLLREEAFEYAKICKGYASSVDRLSYELKRINKEYFLNHTLKGIEESEKKCREEIFKDIDIQISNMAEYFENGLEEVKEKTKLKALIDQKKILIKKLRKQYPRGSINYFSNRRLILIQS